MGGGCQGGCERRIEVFVKIQKKKIGGGGGGIWGGQGRGRLGGGQVGCQGGGAGCQVWGGMGLGGQGGCE